MLVCVHYNYAKEECGNTVNLLFRDANSLAYIYKFDFRNYGNNFFFLRKKSSIMKQINDNWQSER